MNEIPISREPSSNAYTYRGGKGCMLKRFREQCRIFGFTRPSFRSSRLRTRLCFYSLEIEIIMICIANPLT